MNPNAGLRRFAKDSGLNLFQQFFGTVVGLITSVLVARGLGVDNRGTYALVILLSNLVIVFLNSGIEPAITYQTARGVYNLREVIRGTFALTLWVSLIAIAITFALITFGHRLLFPNIDPQYLYLSLAVIPVTLFDLNMVAILRGLQDFRGYNLTELLSQPIVLILTVIFVWVFKLGVLGAVLAVIIRYIVATIVGMILLRRNAVRLRDVISLLLNWSYSRDVLAFGAKAYTYNIVTFLNQRVDVLMLNLFNMGTISIGLYDVAVTLGERMWILSRSVSLVTFSRVAALEDMEAQRARLTTTAARYVLWLQIIFSILVYFFSEWGIVLVYGEDYHASATALRLLLPGIISLGMAHVLSNDIAGRGKPQYIAIQSAVTVVLNIGLNVILIPRLNFVGAALASSISYPILMVLLTLAFCRLSGANWRELFLPTHADLVLWRKGVQLIRSRLKPPLKENTG